jgi:preprotein translocase subunit SecE
MGRLKRKKTSGRKKGTTTATSKAQSSSTASVVTPAAGASKPAQEKAPKTKKIVPLKKSSKPVKAAGGKQKQNIIDKSLQFLREVKVELKKVTWPSRKQAIGSTVVVLILVMIISLFLGIVDMGLSGLIRTILN